MRNPPTDPRFSIPLLLALDSGGIAGFATNKMTGGKHGGFSSAVSGAMLAQGAKMAYGMFQDNKKPAGHGGSHHKPPKHHGGHHGSYQQGGGAGGNGFPSFLGKRDLD